MNFMDNLSPAFFSYIIFIQISNYIQLIWSTISLPRIVRLGGVGGATPPERFSFKDYEEFWRNKKLKFCRDLCRVRSNWFELTKMMVILKHRRQLTYLMLFNMIFFIYLFILLMLFLVWKTATKFNVRRETGKLLDCFCFVYNILTTTLSFHSENWVRHIPHTETS